MGSLVDMRSSLAGLGVSSVLLGAIALLLGALPVLGIPLSICGLLLGGLGIVGALIVGGNLRWPLAGVAISCVALTVTVALAYAPTGYLPDHNVPRPWQPVPDPGNTPPPERQARLPAGYIHGIAFAHSSRNIRLEFGCGCSPGAVGSCRGTVGVLPADAGP